MRTRSSWIRRLALGLAVAVVAGCASDSPPTRVRRIAAAPSPPPVQTTASATSPNIVFILTDDLSWNLVKRRFAPHVVALERRGETFDHYFVADSLCCPSRSTIFTGDYPHDTHVFSNGGATGGYPKFAGEGLTTRTFAVALQQRGYATSMLGKYLNGYGGPVMTPATAPVPEGWSDWHVSNDTGYGEFDYLLNDNGRLDRYGGPAVGCAP